jgi:hypothetical protein
MAGFAGVRVGETGSAECAGHVVRLALYAFPDGTELPYLEVSEQHPWYTGSRRIALSEAVHAPLNLGEMELFRVAGRETDHAGVSTVPAG